MYESGFVVATPQGSANEVEAFCLPAILSFAMVCVIGARKVASIARLLHTHTVSTLMTLCTQENAQFLITVLIRYDTVIFCIVKSSYRVNRLDFCLRYHRGPVRPLASRASPWLGWETVILESELYVRQRQVTQLQTIHQ